MSFEDLVSATETTPSVKFGPKTLEIPMAEPEGYCGRDLSFSLPGVLARRLAAVRKGLMDSDATLNNGSPVRNKRDVVMWLLEQLEA